jgi:diguanylate cyclase (GGDEF)-like protein
MESVRAAIIYCRNTSADEDIFIKSMHDLVAQHGESAYPVIFNTLTTLDLPISTAAEYWKKVLLHRNTLISILGRNIDLITAISDYLHQHTKLVPQSRLVDSGTFDRFITETTHDNLTGLFNRTYFDDTYNQQVSLAKRYNTDLSILFLDIDDFKEVNDTLGHIAGDIALQKVAAIIKAAKRESDIAARYGGEEFVLLMPHTPNVNAFTFAERIRKEIEQTEIVFKNHTFRLTISGGLASYPLDSTDPKNLLSMADSALYLAKGAGKNVISPFKQEQRRYLRVKMNKPVLISDLDFSNGHVFSGTSKDIGMGGMLLENNTPLQLGSFQKMSVPVNSSLPLLLIGRVVRIEKHGPELYNIGMSFSFKEMAKQASNQIANFLKDDNKSQNQLQQSLPTL